MPRRVGHMFLDTLQESYQIANASTIVITNCELENERFQPTLHQVAVKIQKNCLTRFGIFGFLGKF